MQYILHLHAKYTFYLSHTLCCFIVVTKRNHFTRMFCEATDIVDVLCNLNSTQNLSRYKGKGNVTVGRHDMTSFISYPVRLFSVFPGDSQAQTLLPFHCPCRHYDALSIFFLHYCLGHCPFVSSFVVHGIRVALCCLSASVWYRLVFFVTTAAHHVNVIFLASVAIL